MSTMAGRQADQVLQETTRMIDAAVASMQLRAGDAHTVVVPGWPVQVIGAAWRRVRAGVVRRRNEQSVFFSGRTLVMRREDNGVVPAGSLGVPGGNFAVTVLGETFEGGRVMVPEVRRPEGGLLVWRFTFSASVAPVGFSTAFDAPVELREYALDAWPAATFPTLHVVHHDSTGARVVVSAAGEVFQLCAHYDSRGVVTVYQETPRPRGNGPQPYLFGSVTG